MWLELISKLLEVGARAIDSCLSRTPSTKRGHTDIVTPADRLSEHQLLSELDKWRPLDAVLSEESGYRAGSTGLTWVIDPLDGTANFAAGRPDYGVIVGLCDTTGPLAGGFVLPELNSSYVSSKGEGAYRNGARILGGDGPTNLREALVDVGVYQAPDPQFMIRQEQVLAAVLKEARGVRAAGSSVIFHDLLEGRLGGAVTMATQAWDLVGPSVVLSEAGVRASDHAGKALSFMPTKAHQDKRYPAVFGTPGVHAQLIDLLAR